MGKMRWLVGVICGVLGAAAHAQMTWEVVNRFPLLSEDKFKVLEKLALSDTVGLEVRLTQVDYRNDVKHLDGSSAWDEEAGRYDASRLLAQKASVVARTTLGTSQCTWTLTNASGEAAFSGRSSCEQSPALPVVLGAAYELRAVRVDDGQADSVAIRARKHLVVALGDSFTSGEGNPDYPAVFKAKYTKQPPHDWAVDEKYPAASILVSSARWLGTDCHRSLLSWPALYAMRKALSHTDTVVQFASFACSGAEVIDGFLLRQRNPPGRIGVDIGGKDWFARESQQRQLAKLLCQDKPTTEREVALDADLQPYLEKYGNPRAKAKLSRCDSPIKPDEVLIQFGGNDTSFGGVVKYVFQPQQIDYRGGPLGWFIGSGVNFGLYKALTPVHPDIAATHARMLPKLYPLLKEGLAELGIEASKMPVRMVMYPDPVTSSASAAVQEAELSACNLRTRDGNRPMQSLIAGRLGLFRHDGALAGANIERLKKVRSSYIPTLRGFQQSAAEAQNWQLTDSQPAMVDAGLCAGSLECERLGVSCLNGDRVRWAFWKMERPSDRQYIYAPNTPPLEQMSDFRPYDLERKRGMRYANDAMLTSARAQGSRVRLDWVAGIAHPTAPVHARIAGLLATSEASATSPHPIELQSLDAPPSQDRRQSGDAAGQP